MTTKLSPIFQAAPFHTTQWTRVCLAKADSDDGRKALADLCDAYYEPVVAYLRSVLRDADAARDMSHAFFAEVLAGGAIRTVDREHGRFRSYLLGAVKHFLSHQREAARSLKRGGGVVPVSLDEDVSAIHAIPDAQALSPEAEFDRQWALTVLAQAMKILRTECAAEGKAPQFETLKPSRKLKPQREEAAVARPLQKRVYETDLWCKRGHLNHDQADKYAEICESLQPRHVLETGFCTGRSAACVLHHSRKVERMTSIDINLDYKAPHGRRMAALLEKRFPFWRIIENSSRVILTPDFFREEFPQGIDLATIDGDHSYDGCMHDLEAVAPFMTPSGIMMVDDYRSGPPNGTRIDSVTRSVDDFLAKNKGVFFGERWHKLGKGFCIIRRVS